MTAERIQHVLAVLLTADGRGAAAKGELLLELLLYASTDVPPLHAEIALAVAGSCLLCGSRIHVTRECPQHKVSKCTS
jgi:hypothetical protein